MKLERFFNIKSFKECFLKNAKPEAIECYNKVKHFENNFYIEIYDDYSKRLAYPEIVVQLIFRIEKFKEI